jgi:hypothetical protein
MDLGFIFVKKNASGPGAQSSGPRSSSGLWVHGGPRAVVAEGLTGSRARGRFGDWKLTSGEEKGKRKPRGFLPWVRVRGAVPEGGRRQREMEHGVGAWCWAARGMDKWS